MRDPSVPFVGTPELDPVVAAVDLREPHPHVFGRPGRQVLADEVGADRQLAVAAVDEHRELHRARPAELEQRVERGAGGAAGEQHVVDEHDDLAGDVGHLGRAERRDRPQPDVVAVERRRRARRRGTSTPSNDAIAAASRRASATPRVYRPTSTTSSAPWLRSTISCAIRVSARRRSAASKTPARNANTRPASGAASVSVPEPPA